MQKHCIIIAGLLDMQPPQTKTASLLPGGEIVQNIIENVKKVFLKDKFKTADDKQ